MALPDQGAVIDISSDPEGNNFGDISDQLAEGHLQKSGRKVYTLFPENCEMGEERYKGYLPED